MTSIFAAKAPLIILISLLAATPLAAQTILEKAARDEIAAVADTDPNMAAAQGAIDARGFSQSRRGAKAGHTGLLSQSCRSRR